MGVGGAVGGDLKSLHCFFVELFFHFFLLFFTKFCILQKMSQTSEPFYLMQTNQIGDGDGVV